MPRLARLTIAGELHFVAQRALGGRKLFQDDTDRAVFVDALREAAVAHAVAVDAYALLDDAVWWLATPTHAPNLGLAVQAIGRRFVAACNRRHGLRGTVWEGRFRSCVVDGEALAQDLIVLLEQEPVARGLAASAGSWAWSSARHHLGVARAPWLRDHPALWGMGNTPFEREAAYDRRLHQVSQPSFKAALERAANRGWAFGAEAFQRRLGQSDLPRPTTPKRRGRPGGLALSERPIDVSPFNE